MHDEFVDMESLLNDICGDCNSEATVRENYSGRGMYGKNCWGIITDNYIDCIERAALRGLTGAQTDNMGRHMIVYWPHPEFTDECLDSYGIEEQDEV